MSSNPFVSIWKKMTAARTADFLEKIEDAYYYRVANRTEEEVTLEIPVYDQTVTIQLPVRSSKTSNRVLVGTYLNALGRGKILELLDSIVIQPLDIEANTDYKISNRTGRRIGIENYDKERGDLILPPFGTRTINSEMLKWYKFLEWQRQDLIQIERVGSSSASSAGALWSILIGALIVFIVCLLMTYNGTMSWLVFGIISLLLLVVAIVDVVMLNRMSKGIGSARQSSQFWDWIKLLPGVVLVGWAGFGIPLWIVYHFGDGQELLASFLTGKLIQPSLTLTALGRLMQVGFICIASILPALFYYLFGRQQVEKLREKFFRDVLILDPHLYTISEAETKYDTMLDSAYGSGNSNSPFAILLLIISTTLSVAGWTLTIAPYLPVTDADSLIDFFRIEPSPMALGFMGAYYFSINMIYRRYVRADLTPKTYASITLRLLVTLVLVWCVGVLPEFSDSAFVANGLLPIAFLIGVFPEEGFRIIRDSARKIIGRRVGGNDEKYPITDLEGMNQYDQARLLEEGIENIENLAHHNLIELLAFTRIPTARLVDMFDQSILYLHLGLFQQTQAGSSGTGEQGAPAGQDSDASASGWKVMQFLKSAGIRTATDLIEVLKSNEVASMLADEEMLKHLRVIRETFKDDEWLSYIMNWRKESSKEAAIKASFVNDPYLFYDAGNARNFENMVITSTVTNQPSPSGA